MGLDIAMLFLSVEESFGLEISDAEAFTLATPRHLIDYFSDHLPAGSVGYCLTQRAFYKLRSGLVRRCNLSWSSIHPTTSVLDIIPDTSREIIWGSLHQEVGARRWPRLTEGRWFQRWFSSSPQMHVLGDVARFVALHSALVLKPEGEGWTRNEIAQVVHGLIHEELGVSPGEYTEDSRWSEDLGLE